MRALFYIVVLLILAGCGFSSSHPRVLEEAQRLLDSDPTAALSKLNSLDISSLQDSATMARWALLYSEAMVVNHLSAPTDTIIDIAIEYYESHNQKCEYQKALRLKALNQSSHNSNELAAALYLQKEKEFFLYKERMKREQLIWIGITSMLVAGGVIIWMLQRLKLQTTRSEALMAEASSFKNQIEVSKGDVNRLESKLHSLLENRFTLIDSLCQTYYETQGTKAERKAIIDKVKYEIEAVKTDSMVRMAQTVNDCRDNLLLKVKNIYPSIKPEDYQLLVYLASGLSSRSISLLLGESLEIIYKRKSRLKSRLKKNVSATYPEIMTIF